MTEKKHPHKRAVDKDKRKKLRESNQSWWRKRDKKRQRAK